MLIAFTFLMGCSGNYANMRNLSESESKAIQQELLDNWSDYNISYNRRVIGFDSKNDDKKMLVPNFWSTVKDQDTWTQLVNGTNKLPNGQINMVWGNPIREIWVSNQFYGYVCNIRGMLVGAKIVDQNTVRLFDSGGNNFKAW